MSICKTIEKHAVENLIVGGDFNLTLNPVLDRLNSEVNNSRSCEVVCTFMNDFGLSDVWRERNPNSCRYTWFKKNVGAQCKNRIMASRIDFFLVNPGIASLTKSVEIKGSTRSDHSLITIQIDNQELIKGPGVWRFNNSLLNNENFKKCMGEAIQKAKSYSDRMSNHVE